MTIFRGNKETLGYTPIFENYYCCNCFEELEYNTMIYDFDTLQYWDYCKNCDFMDESYPYLIPGELINDHLLK